MYFLFLPPRYTVLPGEVIDSGGGNIEFPSPPTCRVLRETNYKGRAGPGQGRGRVRVARTIPRGVITGRESHRHTHMRLLVMCGGRIE